MLERHTGVSHLYFSQLLPGGLAKGPRPCGQCWWGWQAAGSAAASCGDGAQELGAGRWVPVQAPLGINRGDGQPLCKVTQMQQISSSLLH